MYGREKSCEDGDSWAIPDILCEVGKQCSARALYG